MKNVSAKMELQSLSNDQQQRRWEVWDDLLQLIGDNHDKWPNRFVTGDESWVLQYDPKTKRLSMQLEFPDSPRPKIERMSTSKVKRIWICFFEFKGIVYPFCWDCKPEALSPSLEHLRQRVRFVKPELFPNKSILNHEDGSHAVLSVREFLAL
jgi:hypothetical protein